MRMTGAAWVLLLAGSSCPRVAVGQGVAPLRLRVAGVDSERCISDPDLRSGIAQVYGEAPFARATDPARRELVVIVERSREGWRALITVVDLGTGTSRSLRPLTERLERCAELQHGLVVAIWGWLQDEPTPRADPHRPEAPRIEPPRAEPSRVEPPRALEAVAPSADAPSPPRPPVVATNTPWPGVRLNFGGALLVGVSPTIAPGVSLGVTVGSPSWWFGASIAWHRALAGTFPDRDDVSLSIDRGSTQLRACGGWRSSGACLVVDGALFASTTARNGQTLDAQSWALSAGVGAETTFPASTRLGVAVRVDAMAALMAPEFQLRRGADSAVVAAWSSPAFWLGVTVGPSLRVR